MSKDNSSKLTAAYRKNKTRYDNLLTKKFYSDQYNDALLVEIFIEASEIDAIDGINVVFREIVRSKNISSTGIKIMIELGVDPINYSDALDYCFIHNDIDFAKYLVEDLGINVNDFIFENMITKYSNNTEMVKLLLDNGLVLSDNTSIFYTIPETIKFLLDSGIDINNILKFNRASATKEVINLLIDEIKKSTTVIKQEYLDHILLINYERLFLSLEQIKILVNSGANPRIQNDYPFIIACSYDDIDTVKYFLHECCSDINARNSMALINAIGDEHFELAKYLIELGIKITDKVISSCLLNVRTLPLLLNNGVNAEHIGKILWDTLENTEMESYETQAYATYMKELVKHGVDFNQIILS